jgi:hypothetical protein
MFATVFTVKNYWMLREMSSGLPGKHDEVSAVRADQPKRGLRYDSDADPRSGADAAEWTGPVTPYTPADRR